MSLLYFCVDTDFSGGFRLLIRISGRFLTTEMITFTIGHMKIKTDGIILDIDGTIWDSTEIVARAWNRAVKSSGINREEPISAELLKTQFGKPMNVIADNIFVGASEESKIKMMEHCCRYEHEELFADPCDIFFPGVVDTIRDMSKRVPFFIVSNCQTGYIELVCDKAGIMDCITDYECFGNTGNGKAENIRAVIERNGLSDPVYVGDTLGDLEACNEAAVPFIFASYGFGRIDEKGAAAVISSFGDLKDLFDI